MKKAICFLIFFAGSLQIFSQKEASNWYFGYRAGVTFNSGAPTTLTDGELFTTEGCATISDSNGNLLFYTDGRDVWNRNHQFMPNGRSLKGHASSAQSAIIVPAPGNANQYNVFTTTADAGANGLQYNIVDMGLDGGLGDVNVKNILLETPVTEKLTAVAHANGTDIWVISRRYGSNEFIAYLVTVGGLNTSPIRTAIGLSTPVPDNDFSARGCIKVSPDGQFLVSASPIGLELFRFDNATGVVSDFIDLTSNFTAPTNATPFFYGAEFSPDSSKLYIDHLFQYLDFTWESTAYQLDLSTYNATNISNSIYRLSPYVSTQIMALQLAIDGKIYFAQFDESYLGVIDNPNVSGAGAGFTLNAVNLGGRLSKSGLPPFIQSYFIVDLQAANFCLGDTTSFSIDSAGTITSITWDFGDGNTSTLETPDHVYAASGNYTVNVTVNTTTGISSDTEQVFIYDTPTANLVSDFEVCSINLNYEFDLSTKDLEVLGSLSAADNTITYYPNLTDAQNGTDQLPILYTNTAAAENITARISNKNNPGCFDTESFDLIVKEAPILNPVTDWTVCDTDLDGLHYFDLTEKDTEILNGQDATTFSVSYYADQADADASTNSLPPSYPNIGSPQQVFFRIANTAHPDCYETGSFNLEVIEQVLMNEPSNFIVCDDDNDGFYTFNLTTKYNEIVNSANTFDVDITFHLTGKDLIDRTNAVDPTNFTNTIAYNQNLFIRVEHADYPECYTADNLGLVVNDSPTLGPVNDWEVCDDDNDGIHEFDLTQKGPEILGNQNGIDFTITYHITQADADAGQNSITGSLQNSANPQKIYYRIENSTGSGCYLTDSFGLRIFDTPTANKATPIIVCETNLTGIQTFDLSPKDDEILKGQHPTVFLVSYFRSQSDADANENPVPKTAYANTRLQETVYARIQNAGTDKCYEVSNFEIIINPLPDFSLAETYVICPDSPELTIDGGDFESWSWRDVNGAELQTSRNFNITDLGGYSLTVTRTANGVTCERTVPFEVVSSGAPVDFTTEIGDPSDNVTIIVNATGTGDFEYSTDGENFQDGNRLEVFPGEHIVYVRDKFLCRTISKEVIALGYQRFFTPNNDGIHENWNIIGAYHYPGSQLYIYDRYGKLLRQVSPMAVGWDGTLNGKLLTSSDYWFRYVFDGGKVFTGHFSLKR